MEKEITRTGYECKACGKKFITPSWKTKRRDNGDWGRCACCPKCFSTRLMAFTYIITEDTEDEECNGI